jgi:hypothetical protein
LASVGRASARPGIAGPFPSQSLNLTLEVWKGWARGGPGAWGRSPCGRERAGQGSGAHTVADLFPTVVPDPRMLMPAIFALAPPPLLHRGGRRRVAHDQAFGFRPRQGLALGPAAQQQPANQGCHRQGPGPRKVSSLARAPPRVSSFGQPSGLRPQFARMCSWPVPLCRSAAVANTTAERMLVSERAFQDLQFFRIASGRRGAMSMQTLPPVGR